MDDAYSVGLIVYFFSVDFVGCSRVGFQVVVRILLVFLCVEIFGDGFGSDEAAVGMRDDDDGVADAD